MNHQVASMSQSAVASAHSKADEMERKQQQDQQKKFHNLLKEMMYTVAQRRANCTAAAHVLLGALTSPLMTLSITMQVSMPQYRVPMTTMLPDMNAANTSSGSRQPRTAHLRFSEESISQQNSKIEKSKNLGIKNQSLPVWRPYKPASYLNYNEALKGLFREGNPWAFYKGNLTRSIHIVLYHKMNTNLTFAMEAAFGPKWKEIKDVPILQEFILATTVDLMLHPLHLAESRFVLGHRSKNFAVYPSLRSFISTTPLRDMMRASLLHMPRNFLVALSGLKIQDEITIYNYYGQTFASQTLAYPFMLIQRRLETVSMCSKLAAKGLPNANSADVPTGFFGMAKQILSQEGVKGFYKGYSCYIMAIMLWMGLLPKVSEEILKIVPYFNMSKQERALQELSGSQGKIGRDEANNEITANMNYGFDDDDDDDDDDED